MHTHTQRPILASRLLKLALACTIVALVALTPTFSGAAPAFKVLIFKNTPALERFHAPAVAAGVTAITELGQANNFAADVTDNPASFTSANLAQYRAVIFLSSEGQSFTTSQKTAFQQYIAAGGGYVGVHGAVYMQRTGWDWYRQLVGANVPGGAPPLPDNLVDVNVVDPNHPSTQGLPGTWQRKDEWYNFIEPLVSNVNVLLTVDENDYDAGPNKMGNPHPIAWYHNFQGGRAWYTGGGHYAENYTEPNFRKHLLGGILWAANAVPTSTPTPTRTTLPTATPQPTPTAIIIIDPPLAWRDFIPLALK